MAADGALAERLARRDEAALAELYDRLGPRVYALALSILADEGEAQETTSDAFLQVWERAHEFSAERGSLDAWVITIARSRAIDRVRTARRRARLRDASEYEIAVFTLSERDPGPERTGLVRAELARSVRPALARLPVEQRRVIELAYLGGLTHREIAEELEAPLGTVKTRLRTGMQTLRAALRPVPDLRREGGAP